MCVCVKCIRAVHGGTSRIPFFSPGNCSKVEAVLNHCRLKSGTDHVAQSPTSTKSSYFFNHILLIKDHPVVGAIPF